MFKTLKTKYYTMGAMTTMGILNVNPALADGTGNNFNAIAKNIVGSISSLPALLSALSYLFGLILGVLGIMKIKDHVENPGQTPLKDGAIRLAAGGALFALPIVFEAMFETVGDGTSAKNAKLNQLNFNDAGGGAP